MAAHYIRSDPTATRHFILFEFLEGKQIFETYKRVCKRLGDMDYVEFEYWYMKFARGEFNLNDDRSADRVSATFADLPEDIFMILDSHLRREEKHNLRNISKQMQRITASWKPVFNKIKFFDDMPEEEWQKYAKTLADQNLDWRYVRIDAEDEKKLAMITSILEQGNHPIRVKMFACIAAQPGIVKIISKLDPEVLRSFEILYNNKAPDTLDSILKLDQVQRLYKVWITTQLSPSEFPLETLFNVSNLDFTFPETEELKPLVSFIDGLSKKSNRLELCRFNFSCHRHWRRMADLIEKAVSSLGRMISEEPLVCHISVRGASYFYEIDCSLGRIYIERKEK